MAANKISRKIEHACADCKLFVHADGFGNGWCLHYDEPEEACNICAYFEDKNKTI